MIRWKSILTSSLDKLREAFPKDDKPCPGCAGPLKGLPPTSVICRCCADSLAEGFTVRKAGRSGEQGTSGVLEAISVAPKPEIRDLALKLMEGDAPSRNALAEAYAHAVMISEYMFVDAVYLLEQWQDEAAWGPRAFARSVASAFAVTYRGVLQEEEGDWQEDMIARYSKGTKKSPPRSIYPVVVAGSEDNPTQSDIAAMLVDRGAERMMLIEAPKRGDG